MSVTGKIKKITDVQERGTFRFRKLILETQEKEAKYNQTICIDFIANNCGLLDVWKQGDLVEVQYNLRGREGQIQKERFYISPL